MGHPPPGVGPVAASLKHAQARAGIRNADAPKSSLSKNLFFMLDIGKELPKSI